MMTPQETQRLAEQMRDVWLAFEHDGERSLARLAALYDVGLVFHDPLQTLKGREAFLSMNRRLLRRARRIAFDVPKAIGAVDALFLVWTMTYEPRRGRPIVFEGSSFARVRNGLVVEQRDYWDLLSSVACSTPLLRGLYKTLAPHLA
jgi:hypothetical protein